jgi:hypothetical protein
MIKKIYSIVALALFFNFIVTKADSAHGPRLNADSQAALEPPALEPYPFTTNQTDIGLFIGNYNEGGVTELYRSTNSTTGFVLIRTFEGGGTEYTDRELKPRTTYYYRARVARNSEYSEYVYLSMETASKYFNPDISATANSDGSVTLSLTDNTYQEENYEILRDGEIVPFFVDGYDSGRVFTYRDTDVLPNSTYHYVVNAWLKDEGTPFIEDVANATVTTSAGTPCSGAGGIDREKWDNVAGRNVSYIPLNRPADVITTLTEFSAPTNDGTNYGVRVRGYVCPPTTGNYVFFIASDDESQLFLSTDANPSNKRKIANVLDHTGPLVWSQYPSQRSAEIPLVQGQLYYIEALHKEASGGDNLAVGWQLPGGTLERPIPGNRLIPFARNTNNPPLVEIVSPFHGQLFSAPADVTVQVNASDAETSVSRVEIWRGTTKLGEDTQAPFSIFLNDLPAGAYAIEARAFDTEDAQYSDFVNFSVKAQTCSGTGGIQREFWLNVAGTSVSSVPFNTPPQSYKSYSNFETDQYEGTNYGSRMRAYICVPQNGNYTFWISSDDNSQLWLSTDDTPENKKLIASVTGATKFREYTKYTTQKSVAIPLQAGMRYYIEALHKEGTGNDFVSVGWQLPDGTMERPILGNRLIPIGLVGENQSPVVTFMEPEQNERFDAGSDILLRVNASDPDGSIYQVQFEANSQVLNVDASAPYEYQWNDVPAGTYRVIARATDNQGRSAIDAIDIVVGEQYCTNTGKIYREVWTGVTGTSVSSIPVGTTPNRIIELTDFSTPNYYGNDYGARIRGYLCVPVTGAYTFYIASDDNSELWLSTDNNPANKVKIAYLNGAVPVNVWEKYPTQKSATIALTGGQQYYIEALHKEGNGADHVSVAWRFQNGDFEGPIPGNRLIPYVDSETSAAAVTDAEISAEANESSAYPNPVLHQSAITIQSADGIGDGNVEFISTGGVVLQQERVTFNESGESKIQLNEKIIPGIYFIKIFSNRQQRVLKLKVD